MGRDSNLGPNKDSRCGLVWKVPQKCSHRTGSRKNEARFSHPQRDLQTLRQGDRQIYRTKRMTLRPNPGVSPVQTPRSTEAATPMTTHFTSCCRAGNSTFKMLCRKGQAREGHCERSEAPRGPRPCGPRNDIFQGFSTEHVQNLALRTSYRSSLSRRWVLSPSVEILIWSIESRSRRVTVWSWRVWPSMVIQNGVPASSCLR